MTNEMRAREKAICEVANVDDIGEVSDGFHTFNSLYEQRMILFVALVKAYKDKSWKSYRHEDGEYCFGGGWFIVGIDTPEGSYTYHYENKYWNMFDCTYLPRAKHWDGHTEADTEVRLMSLKPRTHQWIPVSERLPKEDLTRTLTTITTPHKGTNVRSGHFYKGMFFNDNGDCWKSTDEEVLAWMPLPEPYQGKRKGEE